MSADPFDPRLLTRDEQRPSATRLPPTGELDFLRGGGEMGERMRALDWTATPLGPPARWPQSLKTIVRVMLDSRYAMWMLWGPELTFFCNDAYLPTVGLKRDWVLGARSDKVWEEVWPVVRSRITNVLERGEATWDENLQLFLERRGFSEETYHTFSYSPVYDDESHVAGMLCVVTEVTERVIVERRLRLMRDLGARTAVTETSAEACRRLCDILRQYPFDVPFAALYLLEANGEEAVRVGSTCALPTTLAADHYAVGDSDSPIVTALREGRIHTIEGLPDHDMAVSAGLWPDLVQAAMVLPLKGSGQDLCSGVLIVGLSPRRPLDEDYRSFMTLVAGQVASAIADAQAYEAERRRAEALSELDRAKTIFFSNVSHEFRTPLTLMMGPTERALASADRVLQGADLERVHRSQLRLLKLVNTLLEFSRIEAGRAQAAYEATDLSALTRDVASTFRSAIERAGLTLTVESAALAQPVYVDRDMWEKIVLNLLSNALKFTLTGGIAVRLRDESVNAVLEVEDTGVGIPEHEMPRLFERFHRIEGTQGRTQEGSGIGLALVHELVKLHGGRVRAASRLGVGTIFRVEIPFGARHLPPDRIRQERARAPLSSVSQAFVQEAERWLPTGAGEECGKRSLQGVEPSLEGVDRRFAATFGSQIILADDNTDMREYVRDLLAPSYRVVTVADGEQALAAAREQRPDLILSDVMMPRLDGFGLLRKVRSDALLRDVPFILLSARAGQESRIEGFDAGADDYLAKPFSARELVARVGALLERRRAQEAFRLRTAQYETLLNEAPLGVYLVDSELRIREVNPTAAPLFGDIPDLIGRDFDEVVHILWSQPYADELVRLFRHTLQTGAAYSMPEAIEERLDRGATEYYEWQINRIPLPDGRYGVVCYFRDISAPVRARMQLEAADRHKNEFLAMLAHELRNPLAPIRNAGELLARMLPTQQENQTITGILQRQVGHLTRLVDDLLDVSRITQGRIELRRRPVQLADIVAQALETVEPLIKEKQHSVGVVCAPKLRVNGDPARLVQCLVNVITNAAKFTAARGSIRIEAAAQRDEAVLTITDDGPGISAELLPKVFDLFVQSERTLDRSQGGLGIGLSVVKRLMEMHEGSAYVASAGPGSGTRVELRLPLILQHEEPTGESVRSNPSVLRILVVDDNTDAAETLGMLLRLDGHEVAMAYRSRDGLDRAHDFHPDVVLLDIGLPDIDGYEVCRRMRASAALRGIHLIAVTGYGQAGDVERAKSAGFDGHLVKPIDVAVLQRVLQAVAARRKAPVSCAASSQLHPASARV